LADLDELIQAPLLVPIPSWKRRANPLPGAFAQQLGQGMGWQIDANLLLRRRPVLGQHHLGRQLRWANQAEAFLCAKRPRQRRGPRQPLLLVDDILTTGATLWGAAETLRLEGWRVAGACCLARTPAKGSQEAKGAVI
jgi:predicted amidophosphoribosyltransferase